MKSCSAPQCAGEGLGVEPFRPNRGPLKLSPNMIIENLAKVLDISADTINSISDFEAAPGAQEAQPPAPGTGVRMWTVDEAAAAAGTLQTVALCMMDTMDRAVLLQDRI